MGLPLLSGDLKSARRLLGAGDASGDRMLGEAGERDASMSVVVLCQYVGVG